MAFDSLYTHGFARVAAAVPHLRPAEPAFNVERTLGLARGRRTSARRSSVFPELGLSAVRDRRLLPAGRADRRRPRRARSARRRPAGSCSPVLVVGGPLRAEGGAVQRGVRDPPRPRPRRRAQELPAQLPRVLRGAPVPRRARARSATASSCSGETVPFGSDLVFARRATCPASRCTSRSARTSGCRCRRAPSARWRARPCSRTCRASNITVGKADFRRTLCTAQSGAHDRGLHLHRRGRAASRRPTSPGTARR